MKEYTFKLKTKHGRQYHKVVIASDYPNAINKLTFDIRNGAVIDSFTTRPIKYKYVVTITDVTLENQGEWGFTFNDTHVILSPVILTDDELNSRVRELDIDIESDTDDPYEDGYTVNEFDYKVLLYQEGGE